jgi:hypothetical protein
MSENAILAALCALGYRQEVMTGHGFRAMARTMLAEALNYLDQLAAQAASLPVVPLMGAAGFEKAAQVSQLGQFVITLGALNAPQRVPAAAAPEER